MKLSPLLFKKVTHLGGTSPYTTYTEVYVIYEHTCLRVYHPSAFDFGVIGP